MTGIGRSLPVYQGNESWMLPIPATFVVNRDGRITARFVDPDYRKRMAIDELIAALRCKRGRLQQRRWCAPWTSAPARYAAAGVVSCLVS
jgi:hypothetical protein